MPIADFIPALEQETGRPIIDRTGLTGQFSFVSEYTTPVSEFSRALFLFSAQLFLRPSSQQLGLKFEPVRNHPRCLDHRSGQRSLRELAGRDQEA